MKSFPISLNRLKINVTQCKEQWQNPYTSYGVDILMKCFVKHGNINSGSRYFFFYQDFLSRTLTTHRITRKGGDHLLFLSTTSTRLRTFRHLVATLHVRWISHIFNRTACIYHVATRWDLPLYRITIWLINDVMLIFFCLFMWWFDSSFFCYSNLRRETSGFELALTITLLLQANRLTKCASHL